MIEQNQLNAHNKQEYPPMHIESIDTPIIQLIDIQNKTD